MWVNVEGTLINFHYVTTVEHVKASGGNKGYILLYYADGNTSTHFIGAKQPFDDMDRRLTSWGKS